MHVTVSILLPHVRSDISIRKTNTHSFIIDVTGSSKSNESNLHEQRSHLVNIARALISYADDLSYWCIVVAGQRETRDKNATDQ